MSSLLIAQLAVLLSSCVLVGMFTYAIGRKNGRRQEVRDRIRRMESMYDSLAVTWDEETLPKKFQQPRAFRWN